MLTRPRLFIFCLAVSAPTVAAVADQGVYPLKNQSQEQQKQDEARCVVWAKQQSGFDPAKPWLAPQVPPPPSSGEDHVRFRSASTRGAATQGDLGNAAVASAIVSTSSQPAQGEVTSAMARRKTEEAQASRNATVPTARVADATTAVIPSQDVGKAVAERAVTGATNRHDPNPKIIVEHREAVPPQQVAGQALFEKARTECLEARGYSVR